jgi:hypothetical protein
MNKQRAIPQQLLQWKERLEKIKIPSRIVFFTLGIASTIWFLFRVIPKPSRASYPCVRAAAPFMSGFVIYLLSLGTALFAFRKFREKILQAKYILASLFLVVSVTASVIYLLNDARDSYAAAIAPPSDPANTPMGTAQGIMPGRVVWAWDSTATNAFCGDSIEKDSNGLQTYMYDSTWDFYYNPKNNDQAVIDDMIAESIKKIANKSTEEEAWDAIFHYFNKQKHGQDSGYKTGQIIFIKVNEGSMSWNGKFQSSDLARMTSDPDIVETSPFVMVAMIKSLVNKAKVPEDKIVIGEPIRNIYKDVYEYIRKYFKNVSVLGNDLQDMFSGANLIALGRMPVAIGNDSIYYSLGNLKDPLYDIFSYADYVINIASLKGHFRAGVTLCAKNNFGSQARFTSGWGGITTSAGHLHDSLLAPLTTDPIKENYSKVKNTGYKRYRPQVDMMGHPKLGGNTLLFVVDGLYSGEDGYAGPSLKWRMAPFNWNYPSSVLMSQDQVALESVCLDFLRNEYDGTVAPDGKTRTACPNYYGVDDYLHQAADVSARPSKIKYKPDGTNEIGSLGTHEHWNNANDKRYSRNLDPVNGKGIELVGAVKAEQYLDTKNYQADQSAAIESIWPNPAASNVNIAYSLPSSSNVLIEIYDLQGRKIAVLKNQTETEGKHIEMWNINQPDGIYICKLRVKNSSGITESTAKIQVMK